MVSGTTSPFGTLWTRRVTGFVISTPDFLPASQTNFEFLCLLPVSRGLQIQATVEGMSVHSREFQRVSPLPEGEESTDWIEPRPR